MIPFPLTLIASVLAIVISIDTIRRNRRQRERIERLARYYDVKQRSKP